ncbi:Rad4-domain-containing protein [Myriangium duriaei CBS 260.36]|uniref:Rad4-domain-containing protein n=1 Tax=Myriangium duriaei CBS 260.36 TaxID=1168546 RepID=A0A9P4MGT9_9PEZI|nr:Rad4-domain-containing protein [Myriangium duriaei CBS 260.36]
MAAGKSKAQTRAEDRILQITSGASRRSVRREANVPEVYSQLLSEASDPLRLEGPPTKRRRVGGGSRPQPNLNVTIPTSPGDQPGGTASNPQTIIDSDESEESDFEWEETGIGEASAVPTDKGESNLGDISIEVAEDKTTQKKGKRRGVSAADRSLALAAHETHFLFLLFHAHVRNVWCNLKPVESQLRGVLGAKVIKLLHPDRNWVQLRQSDSFLEGMKLAVDIWRKKFKINASGLCKAKWVDDAGDLDEMSSRIQRETECLDRKGFITATTLLRGSQDLGNQLFCALLRAVGVEARLVCSLQPLPLTTTGQVKPLTPRKEKSQKPRIYATFESEQDTTSTDDDMTRSARVVSTTKSPKKPAVADGPRRRLGQPSFGAPLGNYSHKPEPTKKKKVQKLDYPVFWVEALNPAYQLWVPVDPLVTGTVGKAAKLEPPASYELNTMSYVFAFEENRWAKDVTRRYVKAFNAKTRKLRVESTDRGQKWLNKATKPFTSHEVTDRDQIEEGELTKKEAQEGLPNNIQDFKDHPRYALERHLKRNEVIWPKRQIGKINAGKSSSSNLEPVYRRSDVQVVQSADKWYRCGRDIRRQEQPMKHVPARSRRNRSPLDQDGQEAETTALYAYSQTELYMPPPVYLGRIPKNAFGNIDIYTSSMVPAGAAHIKHTLAKKAAQLLSIDFADAVTGFQFKGRHGTAIVQGVIVAVENKEAMDSVLAGFENSLQQEEDDLRSFECLRLWRRFLLGLQIAERIGLTDIYAANDERAEELKQELDEAEDEREEVVGSGGFFPDAGADEVVQPTGHLFPQRTVQRFDGQMETNDPPDEHLRSTRRRRRRLVDDDDDDNVTYNPDIESTDNRSPDETPEELAVEAEHPTITDAELSSMPSHTITPSSELSDIGGGFMPDEKVDYVSTNEDTRGGFVPADEDTQGVFAPTDEDTEGGFVPTDGVSEEVPALGELGGGFMPVDEDPDPEGAPAENDSLELQNQLAMGDQEQEIGESSDEEEQGSLLSHDPEDEDADPDWLEVE